MLGKTIRYTATLPLPVITELRTLARGKKIPSVNYAINVAVCEYLKQRKAAQYEAFVREAGNDKLFLERTLSCAEDFCAVDNEVTGKW